MGRNTEMGPEGSSGGAGSLSRKRGMGAAFILAAATVLAIPSAPAYAHEERVIGGLLVEVGWASEPTYAGFANQIFMSVEKGEEPVTDGDLEAEVVFGDPDSDTRSAQIVLDPSDEAPGQYFGGIIPTRPGTYSFHITGTAGGQTIDEMFISGEQTFDDVINPAEAEFPEQDPTNGELSEAIDRLSARIDESGGGATADDQTALWIAIGSGVLALIALIAALRRRPPA